MLSQAHAVAINIIMVFVLVHVCAVQMNRGPLSCVHKKYLYHFMTFFKRAGKIEARCTCTATWHHCSHSSPLY